MTLLFKATKLAVGPTQPAVHWIQGSLSLEIKQLKDEADHLSPSSAEVKQK
jgi:hypothetical protein